MTEFSNISEVMKISALGKETLLISFAFNYELNAVDLLKAYGNVNCRVNGRISHKGCDKRRILRAEAFDKLLYIHGVLCRMSERTVTVVKVHYVLVFESLGKLSVNFINKLYKLIEVILVFAKLRLDLLCGEAVKLFEVAEELNVHKSFEINVIKKSENVFESRFIDKRVYVTGSGGEHREYLFLYFIGNLIAVSGFKNKLSESVGYFEIEYDNTLFVHIEVEVFRNETRILSYYVIAVGKNDRNIEGRNSDVGCNGYVVEELHLLVGHIRNIFKGGKIENEVLDSFNVKRAVNEECVLSNAYVFDKLDYILNFKFGNLNLEAFNRLGVFSEKSGDSNVNNSAFDLSLVLAESCDERLVLNIFKLGIANSVYCIRKSLVIGIGKLGNYAFEKRDSIGKVGINLILDYVNVLALGLRIVNNGCKNALVISACYDVSNSIASVLLAILVVTKPIVGKHVFKNRLECICRLNDVNDCIVLILGKIIPNVIPVCNGVTCNGVSDSALSLGCKALCFKLSLKSSNVASVEVILRIGLSHRLGSPNNKHRARLHLRINVSPELTCESGCRLMLPIKVIDITRSLFIEG